MFLTLFETIDILTRELLFLPLPDRLRIRSQAITEGVLSALGKIFAACVIFILLFFQFTLVFYAALIIFMSFLLILTIIRLSPLYKTKVIQSIPSLSTAYLDSPDNFQNFKDY